jgi:hypothetical protein
VIPAERKLANARELSAGAFSCAPPICAAMAFLPRFVAYRALVRRVGSWP